MKSTPRLPEEGANVSKAHPLGEVLTLVAGVVAVLLVFVFAAGLLVDRAVAWISPATEQLFFRELADALTPSLSKDSEVQVARIRPLFEKLTAAWPDTPYDFKLGVIDSEHPNALALPGGTVLVTSSLLDMVKSENELAMVLGHELGHFKNRDHLRRIGRLLLINLSLSTLGANLGADSNDLVQLVNQMNQGSFSRGQELDADRFGLELVHKIFGHVAGSRRFFKKIAAMPESPSALGSYFSTHPHPEDRIEKLRAQAKAQGWPTTGALTAFPNP
jgi:Zn-dependent protease with chaperone function